MRRSKDIHQFKVLVNHTYFIFKRVYRRRYQSFFAVNKYFTVVGEVNTREHVHKRRLAAAVFAEQRQYLALFNTEIYVIIGDDLTKTLRNVLKNYCKILFHIVHALS